MRCNNCGEENQHTDKRCIYCGNELAYTGQTTRLPSRSFLASTNPSGVIIPVVQLYGSGAYIPIFVNGVWGSLAMTMNEETRVSMLRQKIRETSEGTQEYYQLIEDLLDEIE